METIDLKRTWRALYRATSRPELLDVPTRKAVVVDGDSQPGGEGFRRAIEAIYGVTYALKYGLKRMGVIDFHVLALEALWEIPGEGAAPGEGWQWTAFVAVPDAVTALQVREAAAAAAAKRSNPALPLVRLRTIREGRCAQVLHVGPYDAEQPTIDALLRFVAEQGYVVAGAHHEVYLNDPRRVGPERTRTIIRYAVSRRQ